MTDSKESPPDPDAFRFAGRRLHVPSGLPRRHRAPGGLGHRSFACPIMLPPEDDCPVIGATFKEHAILIGLAGAALLGCDQGEVALGPGAAFGLLAGEFTIESVGARADVGPLIIIAVLTPGAVDRSFELGDLFQLHLNEGMEPMACEPVPDPIGGIFPLPSFTQEVAPFLEHLPISGLVRSIVRAMGGPVLHKDIYKYLALGPARHRVGLECTEAPERFEISGRRGRAGEAAGSFGA